MKSISLEYILKLHKKMVNATGGSDGIKDMALLESAVYNANATFDGIDLYPSIIEKCAVICFGIMNNHPFVDGNKRIGIYVMLILLELNEIKITFSQDELCNLGIGVACGKYTQKNIVKWINDHMRK